MCVAQLLALAGCQHPKAVSIDEEHLYAAGALVFSSSSKLSVTEAATHLRGAIFKQYAQVPVVFLERGYRAKTNGTYSLSGAYSSLSSVIADLNAQSSAYSWELTPSGFVFVYPSTGSFLTELVGPYDATDTWFCTIIEELSIIVNPDIMTSSCMLSGRSIQPRGSVIPIGIMEVSYFPGTKISVKVSGQSTRVLDVIDAAIQKTGRFDATGTKFSLKTPPRWHLNFYPTPGTP